MNYCVSTGHARVLLWLLPFPNRDSKGAGSHLWRGVGTMEPDTRIASASGVLHRRRFIQTARTELVPQKPAGQV